MPNPFSTRRPVRRATENVVTQARGHYDPTTGFVIVDTQETDDGPAPGTAIKPIAEEYEGQNFPYRGTQTHGVDPLFDVPPPSEHWEGGMVPVRIHDEEPEKVTPVRIVEAGAKELIDWRSNQGVVGSAPTIMVGRFPNRKSFVIRNLDAAKIIYVGGDNGVSTFTGYPIKPNETFTVEADSEVWGISEDGTDVKFAYYIVFAVTFK